MQLSGRLLLGMLLLLVALPVQAQTKKGPWTIAVDTLVYSDDDSVIIVSPQVSVGYALDEKGGKVAVRAVVDVVSAASVDLISQATTRFDEVRTEAEFSLSKRFGIWLPSIAYRFSIEPDYKSHSGTLGMEVELLSPDSVLAFSYGFAYDTIGRAGTSFDTYSESLLVHTANLAFTQVIDRKTLFRAVYTLTIQDGFMEKPYRNVPLFDQNGLDAAKAAGDAIDLDTFDRYRLSSKPPEEVPDHRNRHSFALRALRYFPGIDASLRLDYQFYFDSWGVTAHTVEPAFNFLLTGPWRMVLYARVYGQYSADFWQRQYVVADGGQLPKWRTVDRSLTSFVRVVPGVQIRWDEGPFGVYVDGGVTWTKFNDYMLLDERFGLVAQAGFRWTP